MPEVLTKYPESALKGLKDIGAKCGVGARQQILTRCPKEKFCALPTAEICVYGMNDFQQMTQIHNTDLSEALTGVPTIISAANFTLLFAFFSFGLLLGMYFRRK